MNNSFNTRDTLAVGDRSYEIFSLRKLGASHDIARLPYSLKILLENLLRFEDEHTVTRADIEALLNWDPQAEPETEIAFRPARVLMQDFTGVPAVVDLAAMRDAMTALGGDPDRINPLQPAELVIDHSVQVDSFGSSDAIDLNSELEYQRNQERYSFLKWGQKAFDNFKVVPPDTGIVHQVNLEYLARVVFEKEAGGTVQAYPDTLVGTDSHTTMINGLGVHRGRGCDARTADINVDPPGDWFPSARQPAGRRHGNRPCADGCRDTAQGRRGRQVRGIFR